MTNPANSNPSDPTPSPAPEPKPKTRAKAGFIDKALEADLTLADNCSREATKPDIVPLLLAREWTDGDQQALDASRGRCAEFKRLLKVQRTGKTNRTGEEETARKLLLTALDPILKGARRTFPDGSADRAFYGIGKDVANLSTRSLLDLVTAAAGELAPGPGNAAPKAKLKGVTAGEIAVLSQLSDAYEKADWAQGDAQQDATQLLAQLRKEVEKTLNPLRRDLQGAADQAFTHREETNATRRQAFGLQPDKSLND